MDLSLKACEIVLVNQRFKGSILKNTYICMESEGVPVLHNKWVPRVAREVQSDTRGSGTCLIEMIYEILSTSML